VSAKWYLAEMCREQGYSKLLERDLLALDIAFIIDEAQQTYVDSHLWYSVPR
jgi:hypothetical protein